MQSAFFPAQQQQQDAAVPTTPPGAQHHNSNKHAALAHTSSSPVQQPRSQTVPYALSSGSIVAGHSRAVRFPSSRRYLWDRTAAAPQVLVDVLDYLPHVQVAASTFGAIARAASSSAAAAASGSLALQLALSVTNSNQICALIQEHDPLSAQGALQLSCSLQQPGAAAADAAGSLRAAMQAQLDQRDIARVQQLFALSASAAAGASPADPTSLRLQLLMPRAGLLATPLYTKRLCHVPLAEALLKPGCMATGQTGYLSMDQARSLLPLEATDANVYSTPLVGVWVKGPSSVLHPLVAAACLRFAHSSLLADRAVNPEDGAFLLLLCPEGDPVSKCFEVHVTDSRQLDLACYRLEAGMRPAAGLSQCPGGLLSGTWVPDKRQVQPLPGTLGTAGAAAAGGGSIGAAGGGFSHSRLASAAGTPQRAAVAAAAGYAGFSSTSSSRAFAAAAQSRPAAADSPLLLPSSRGGRSHVPASSRGVGDLTLGRSSAPSAVFDGGFGGSMQGQQQHAEAAAPQTAAAADAAARRSLPLAYYGAESYYGSSMRPAAAAEERKWEGAAEGEALPLPRTGGIPTVPYAVGTPTSTQLHVPASKHPAWQQQPSLTWSARQDEVLRSSLEGAADALRSSQASLAAAREAASGAGSRLSSPTKPREPVDAAATQTADGLPAAAGAGVEPAAASPSSQPPTLSRLGQQQQPEGGAGGDADSDCGPRMGSPVRSALHKKSSMAAAAAAHAAGMSPVAAASTTPPEGPPSPQGAAGGAAGDNDSAPVSPSVQAGVALSNLSLLQHLSSGQLQQVLEHHSPSRHGSSSHAAHQQQQQLQQQMMTHEDGRVLQAVGHAAVAAAAGGAAAAAAAAGHSPEHAAAVAAAAMRAASDSMQRLPAHPYNSTSLGVQRYAADAAVMRSSQGSPAGGVGGVGVGGMPGGGGFLSPGSSPGVATYGGGARWQQQQRHAATAGQAPPAWSPGAGTAAAGMTPGNNNNRGSSPYGWLPPQQQQHHQQQVSPMSAATSPGWVPDPVAQALQGEVNRLRQQLQQLQHQLRLAGMSLRGPDTLEPPSAPDTPPDALTAVAAMAAAVTAVTAAAGAGSSPCEPPQAQYCPGMVFPVDASLRTRAAHVQGQHSGWQQQQVDQAATVPPHRPTAADADAAAAYHEQQQQQTTQELQCPPQAAAAAAGCAHCGSAVRAEPLDAAAAALELAAPAGSPGAVPAQEQQPEEHPEPASAAAAAAARQRRRKLDFSAAAAAAEAAAAAVAAAEAAAEAAADAAADGAGSNSDSAITDSPAAAAAAAPQAAATTPAAAAAAGGPEAAGGHVSPPPPQVCSSPAVQQTAGNAAATHPAAAKASPVHPAIAPPRNSTSSAAHASGLLRPSVLRSSFGGAGAARASSSSSPQQRLVLRSSVLEVPGLVEVVRVRAVELSEDSDSDEWEDRLLVKYGLK